MNFKKTAFRNKSVLKYLSEKESNGDNDYSELQEFLFSLVAVFEFSATGEPLFSIVQDDWKLFSNNDVCKSILDEIIQMAPTSFVKDGIKDSLTTVSY